MNKSDEVRRLLDAAAAKCSRDGGQLTELRRAVLELVLQAEGPIGAYALLDRLKASRSRLRRPPCIVPWSS